MVNLRRCGWFVVMGMFVALAVLCAANCGQAYEILGTGTASLVGMDLTDQDDINDKDSGTGFDATFFANDEPGFNGDEFAFNVFDNLVGGGNAKWCCGPGGATPFPLIVGATFTEPYELTSFTLTSSNDTPARDPAVWTIEGSNDTSTGLDGTWTPIFSRTTAGSSDWGDVRNQVLRYSPADGDAFLTSESFSSFRLNTTATAGGGVDGAYHALNEIELFGTALYGTIDVLLDRDSGQLTLTNNRIFPVDILGYSIRSDNGALDQAQWQTIKGNSDVDGDGSIDFDDRWTILTAEGSSTDLSEAELDGGDGGVIDIGEMIDFGNVWIKNLDELMRIQLLRSDGTVMEKSVKFTGNGDEPFAAGDLNFDGVIDEGDWPIFRAGSFADLSALTEAQQYQQGDLNGDGLNNLDDFDLFKTAFDGANGVGAFDAMIAAVPEPATWLLLAIGGLLMVGRRYRQWLALVCLVALFVAVTSGPASADILPGTGTNFALGGTATQSTNYSDTARLAGDAVNGSFRETGTHTQGAATDPWWQVIFNDGNQDIDYIQLYNRTDCCQARLRDITIRIRDAADTTDLLVSPVLNPGNVNGGQMTLDWDVLAANGGTPINGGIVRVERASDPNSTADDANVLTLNEVLGLGTDVVRVRPNIAVGSPAIQSSTGSGGVPERAVDGNINGLWAPVRRRTQAAMMTILSGRLTWVSSARLTASRSGIGSTTVAVGDSAM